MLLFQKSSYFVHKFCPNPLSLIIWMNHQILYIRVGHTIRNAVHITDESVVLIHRNVIKEVSDGLEYKSSIPFHPTALRKSANFWGALVDDKNSASIISPSQLDRKKEADRFSTADFLIKICLKGQHFIQYGGNKKRENTT